MRAENLKYEERERQNNERRAEREKEKEENDRLFFFKRLVIIHHFFNHHVGFEDKNDTEIKREVGNQGCIKFRIPPPPTTKMHREATCV